MGKCSGKKNNRDGLKFGVTHIGVRKPYLIEIDEHYKITLLE